MFPRWHAFITRYPILSRTLRLVYWMPIPIYCNMYGFTVTPIRGNSMQPTFNPRWSTRGDDWAILDRLSLYMGWARFERGDVVSFPHPYSRKRIFVKRILGLPGDTVKTLPPYPQEEVVLGPGEAWVEGDNAFESEDSNHFGPVPLALLDSRVVWILLPFHRFGPVLSSRSTDTDRVIPEGVALAHHEN